jgi:hypothetical protein
MQGWSALSGRLRLRRAGDHSASRVPPAVPATLVARRGRPKLPNTSSFSAVWQLDCCMGVPFLGRGNPLPQHNCPSAQADTGVDQPARQHAAPSHKSGGLRRPHLAALTSISMVCMSAAQLSLSPACCTFTASLEPSLPTATCTCGSRGGRTGAISWGRSIHRG